MKLTDVAAKMMVKLAGLIFVEFTVFAYTCSAIGIPIVNDIEEYIYEPIKDILVSETELLDMILTINEEGFIEEFKKGDENPDKNLNLTELLVKYGYKVEVYEVQTEDGYIIPLYRIPGEKGPVLIVHGVFNNAVDWLTLGPEKGLPYLLADRGHDVYMIDDRSANKNSKRHIYLSSTDPKYYDFSYDEIGRYDLPATIDFIINKTGKPTIKYVGFSQGTTTFLVLVTERPEYNEKISVAALLSPVAVLRHTRSIFLKLFLPSTGLIKLLANVVGVNGIDPGSEIMKFIRKNICGNTVPATILCSQLIFMIGGFNYPQLNVTNIANIYSHSITGCSFKQLVHYGQSITAGDFRQFDYGCVKNIEKYGSETPPEYSLDKVNTSVLIFHATDNDWAANQDDLQILYDKLPSNVIKEKYRVPLKEFCHTDYLWAKDVKELLYDKVLELLDKY